MKKLAKDKVEKDENAGGEEFSLNRINSEKKSGN